MRRRAIAAAAGAVAIGTVGYLGGVSANPAPAAAQARPAEASMMADAGSMMVGPGVGGASEMMAAHRGKMMRGPVTRRLHQAMVREHEAMLRDRGMRRLYEQIIEVPPQMEAMMHAYMGG
ncbi:hypothetical protein [Conexibacter sp. DBS9H8]|uniref:hypothetical protein n=1 Tax=Conexibacter sp. DBS9H8 TaxID=2937801 RepID=UPI00200C0B87|nr:hypothetical protein [Conexibacter sp. DBS9H8]